MLSISNQELFKVLLFTIYRWESALLEKANQSAFPGQPRANSGKFHLALKPKTEQKIRLKATENFGKTAFEKIAVIATSSRVTKQLTL